MTPHRNGLLACFLMLGVISTGGVQAQLTGDEDQLWSRSSPQQDEHFGDALASGDFDGDGFADLAIGAPDRDVGAQLNAGAVLVLYGSVSGLSSAGQQVWDQDVQGVADEVEANDAFGAALATGDFDRDGYDDLAIGVPGESDGSITASGAVHVLYGGTSGLTADEDQFITQAIAGISDSVEEDDRFGRELAAGDFNGDDCSDLAIGVPFEGLGTATAAGAVHVVYGSRGVGLTADEESFWHQDVAGLNETAETDDQFGASLAAGDFDGDGADDLMVGVWGETPNGAPTQAGMVHVLYGGDPDGITASGALELTQDTSGVDDACEAYDHFGEALAAGDLDGDGYDDAVIGVPSEDLSYSDAGIVHVFSGAAGGLTGSLEEIWHQDRAGVADEPGLGDRFGESLAAAPFDGTEWDALAVGIPGEVVFRLPSDVGAVAVLYGGWSGLSASGSQFLHQGLPDLLGTADGQDRFGDVLACGDFDGNGSADLAVAVPQQDISTASEAGEVHVLYSLPAVFRDGFEIGDTSAWSAAVGGP